MSILSCVTFLPDVRKSVLLLSAYLMVVFWNDLSVITFHGKLDIIYILQNREYCVICCNLLM
jgi:hypothetical protein